MKPHVVELVHLSKSLNHYHICKHYEIGIITVPSLEGCLENLMGCYEKLT